MSGAAGLYRDVDMAKVMYGQNAVHVPAWLYVQDAGSEDGRGIVSFVGASMTSGVNPLTYGSGHYDSTRRVLEPQRPEYHAHTFIAGEIIVRPHIAIATRALYGYGLSSLLECHDMEEMLRHGELKVGDTAKVAEVAYRYQHGAWRNSR